MDVEIQRMNVEMSEAGSEVSRPATPGDGLPHSRAELVRLIRDIVRDSVADTLRLELSLRGRR